MESEKERLLKKYAGENVSTFYQIDFWTDVQPGDCVMKPDREGDCLTSIYPSRDLMRGSAVRVLIKQGVSQGEAVRGLKKVLQWIESESELPTVGDDPCINGSLPFGKIIANYVNPGLR